MGNRQTMRATTSRHPVDPLGEAKLYLAYCSPGEVDAQFMKSITDFLLFDARNFRHCVRRGGILSSETGPRLAEARNSLIRAFLQTDGTHLLMIDSDMGFIENDVYRLLNVSRENDGAGIVGGLCFGGGHSSPMFPTVYGYMDDEAKKEFRLTRYELYPRDQVFDVDATGAAFTMLSRDLLEAMADLFPEPYPWYAETVKAGTDRNYGEDVVICLRARAMGARVIVDSRVKIKHYKRAILDEDVYIQRMALAQAIDEENFRHLTVDVADDGTLVQESRDVNDLNEAGLLVGPDGQPFRE